MAYIYEHWRPDKNACFYVGKGSGSRANLCWGTARNEHHRRVVGKLHRNGMSVGIKIVLDGLSDKEAFEKEQERIAFYGIENLTNQTAGGEGLRNPTIDTRRKMSAHRQRLLSDPEFRTRHLDGVRVANERDPLRAKRAGLKLRGRKSSDEARANISAALKGKKRPYLSERMKGEGNPFFGKRHSEETLARISIKKCGSKLSVETRCKMQAAQRDRRDREALLKPPVAPRLPTPPFRHTTETIEKMKIAAKKRGISAITRAAQKVAVTGRKRRPFTTDTIARMRLAATAREATKRANREAA
jgi:hypothetical protein